MQEILTLVGFVLEKGGPVQIDQMKTFLYDMKVIIEKSGEMEDGWTAEEKGWLFEKTVQGYHNMRITAIKSRRTRTGEGLREVVDSAQALFAKRGVEWR